MAWSQAASQISGTAKQARDRGLAAVVGSGSKTENGFRILVERSGRTQSIIVPAAPLQQPIELPITTVGSIPVELARRLYLDLDAAWPIASLPKQPCPASASSASSATTLKIGD